MKALTRSGIEEKSAIGLGSAMDASKVWLVQENAEE
jgi:hypothetical protein